MIYLAILNITSWAGQCADAEHMYGHLVLCDKESVTLDNLEEYNIKYLGENIELFRDITLDEARAFDIKDNAGGMYRRKWVDGDTTSNRFDTFESVVDAGIKKWKELDCGLVFISLYEGKLYYSNSFNSAETVILTKKQKGEKKARMSDLFKSGDNFKFSNFNYRSKEGKKILEELEKKQQEIRDSASYRPAGWRDWIFGQ